MEYENKILNLFKNGYLTTKDVTDNNISRIYLTKLIKEDKNLNGAYISIAQYVDLIEKEKQRLKIQISAREEEYKKLEHNWNKLKKI